MCSHSEKSNSSATPRLKGPAPPKTPEKKDKKEAIQKEPKPRSPNAPMPFEQAAENEDDEDDDAEGGEEEDEDNDPVCAGEGCLALRLPCLMRKLLGYNCIFT